MPLLAKLGIVELTVAALSGWVMVATVERPEKLRQLGLRHLNRIRQSHLDFLMMGTILTAVGIAVDPVPTWIGALLVLGAFTAPTMLLPLAVNAELQQGSRLYRTVNTLVLVAFSSAWVGLAIVVIQR